jgi:hypothetical protein
MYGPGQNAVLLTSQRAKKANRFAHALLFHQRFLELQLEQDKKQFQKESLQYLADTETFISPLSLFSGLPGAAWLLSLHADAFDQRELKKIKSIQQKITMLFEKLKPYDLPFELVNGWIGVGWYWISQGPGRNKKRIETVFSYILKQKIKTNFGPQWVSPTKEKTFRIDLGLPHGYLGLLMFFSLCYGHGIKKRQAKNEIEQIVDFLLKIRSAHPERRLPAFLPIEADSLNRTTAWCYGELIFGATLVIVGKRLKNSFWVKKGMELFLSSAKNVSTREISDPYLCHGAAGVTQVCWRVFQATKNKKVHRLYKQWLSRTQVMAARWNKSAKNKSVAEGWFYDKTGIQLVLGSTNKKTSSWDSFLLLSDPSNLNRI